MTGGEIAAALEASAELIDTQLAVGVPPKYLANQAIAVMLEIAAAARSDTDGWVWQ